MPMILNGMSRWKDVARLLAAIGFICAGAFHFVDPAVYVKIMPSYLSWHLQLVYASGFLEVVGGIGLLVPRVRRAAAFGLVALLIAVFPANLNIAFNQLPFGERVLPAWALWARLPVQIILIGWVLWCSSSTSVLKKTESSE